MYVKKRFNKKELILKKTEKRGNIMKKLNEMEKAEKSEGMEYCIVRTDRAGVFAGYIESKNGQEAVMRNVRKLWYWDGANAVEQLAVDGTNNPRNCKFTVTVDKIELTDVLQIIECTKKAKESILGVMEWRA